MPELGPSLGRLIDPPQPAAGPLRVRLDDIRLEAGHRASSSWRARPAPSPPRATRGRRGLAQPRRVARRCGSRRSRRPPSGSPATVNARLEAAAEESRFPAATAARARPHADGHPRDRRAPRRRRGPLRRRARRSWSRQRRAGPGPGRAGSRGGRGLAAPRSPRPRGGWRRPGSRWRRRRPGSSSAGRRTCSACTPGGCRAGRSG